LPQEQVEQANVAYASDPRNAGEAMKSVDASKWEQVMKEKYASLMAIYRLRQSRRAWYMDVDALFAREDYKRSHADHPLYIKQRSEYLVIVIVYVDDLIIMTNTMSKMLEVKAMLKSQYDMTI